MSEEWRDVVGHFGYQVSNLGRVRSRRRSGCAKGRTTVIADEWQLMTPFPVKGGYMAVNLRSGGRRVKQVKIHVLVLEAFVGPRPEGFDGCHGPTGPADNRLSNLRWDTKQANIDDRDAHGTTARGSCNGWAKLTEPDAARIKGMQIDGMSLTEIWRHFPHVTIQAVHSVLKGKTWKHVEAAAI